MPGEHVDDERCRDFVACLERMLEGYKWSGAELARRCNYSPGVVSNIVGFHRRPTVPQGEGFDKAFGVTGMFAAKARVIRGEAFPESFQDFPAHEAAAHDLYIYQHSVFPGLLQTEAYMRAVFMTLPNITADEVNRRVAGRLERQEILYREDPAPPRVWALIDEAALRRPVADAAVMREQCMRALELGQLPHVSLAVVPYAAGGHIGLSGACDIVERDGVPRVVNLDHLADGDVSEDPAIVRLVALRFRSLQHEALSAWDSRDMIARMTEELWNGKAPTGVRALTALPTAGHA
jgi:hypothetical protein